MRKLYNEFFHISKDGQISEKVMLVRITAMSIIMILCLLAMSVSAYAYFSYNVTSVTTIKAATFEVDVSVKNGDVDIPVTTQTKDNLTYQVAQLKAGTVYKVTISHSQNSTANTGYVSITANDCADKYHTQQLNKAMTRSINVVSFSIKPSADTTIYFLANWGTSSYYDEFIQNSDTNPLYITQDEAIEINVERAEPPKKDTTSSEEQDTSSVTESSDITDTSSEASTQEVSSDTVSETVSSSSEETSSETVVSSQDTSSQVTQESQETVSEVVSEVVSDEE